MEPLGKFTGIVAPLDALNVDTDQIIPKQFLKRIERTGYGPYLFYDQRYLGDGKTPNPDFEMNQPRYRDASILLSKENFGCGSSREHAPWAIADYGFRCVLATSFADIFFNNCFNNGILPARLAPEVIEGLFAELRANPGYRLTIDLPAQRVIKPDGTAIAFEIDPFRKECLVNGWDHVGLTLRFEKEIAAYEQAHGIG